MTGSTKPSGRILVVDDHSPVRQTVVEILVQAGYAVAQASDFDGALSELAKGDVALLIVDLGRPGQKKGLMLLDHLTLRPPVILMSGLGEDPPVDPRISIRLTKPVSPARLLEEVARHMAGPGS